MFPIQGKLPWCLVPSLKVVYLNKVLMDGDNSLNLNLL
uniref:Uncharacterized protein n=1 Tax=Aegilops tauschii subsp. strangulata TaxID=200361 RepID=A0A453NXX1_AEGTS